MATLSEQIEKSSKGLLKMQPEGQNTDYQCFNDAGVECQTGEFLYGLVRLIRPNFILETGTHIGVSAAYMASAMRDNNLGYLYTVEYEKRHYERAMKLFDTLNLDRIQAINGSSLDFMPPQPVDLIFLDTEPQIRFAEVERFFQSLNPGGFMLIHDLHDNMHQVENKEHGFAWPYGKISVEFRNLVRLDKLRPIHFKTPRGLTMFYKPDSATYRWR